MLLLTQVDLDHLLKQLAERRGELQDEIRDCRDRPLRGTGTSTWCSTAVSNNVRNNEHSSE